MGGAVMDYQAMDFWWKVFITLMNAGVWLYLFLLNRNRVTNERINRMETTVNETIGTHSDRISRLEKDVSHSPTHDDLGKLYERMNGLERRLSDRIEHVSGAVQRIEGENAAQTRILNLVYESLVKP